MKTFKKILLGLVAFIVLFVLIGFLLPRHLKVARSRDIAAPVETIQAQIVELRNWPAWSPWQKLDPNMKMAYSTPSAGAGAWYTWESDKAEAGSGKMTLLSVSPDSIYQQMDFGMGDPPHAAFRFAPAGAGKTRVTWLLYTDEGYNPLGRWMSLMMGHFVGKSYDEGLANLARETEKK